MSHSVSKLNQLARQAQGGNTDAFGQLFDMLSDDIYRFLAFRLKDPEDAKDLTSQVFLEAWQNLRRFDPDRSFLTWIFTIARYRLIDHYRAFRSTASLDAVTDLASSTDIEAETERSIGVREILLAVDKLPELYQSVLKLKFIEELDYKEISDITGKTENSLRVITKRGLDKLRQIL